MASNAPWWNPENGYEDKPVIRHSPNHGAYVYPDDRQMERTTHGRGVPVVVPRARPDGRSSAFDPTKAAAVHVDPDAPDGGVVVDLATISGDDMRDALHGSKYPHQVFYKLGQSAQELGLTRESMVKNDEAQERTNSLMPTSYVVPKAARDGGQVTYVGSDDQERDLHTQTREEQAVKPMPMPSQTRNHAQQVQQPQPAPPVQQPQYQAPMQLPGPIYQQQPVYQQQPMYPPQPVYQPPPVDQQVLATLGALAQGMQALTSRVESFEQNAAQPRRKKQRQPPQLRTVPAGHRPESYSNGAEDESDAYRDLKPIPGREGEDEGAEEDEGDEEERRPVKKFKPKKPSLKTLGKQPKQHVSDMEDAPPRDGIIVGFETLKIPFISGPRAEKARKRVFFEFPDMGKQQANYHAVIDGEDCVVLVYDTRYEDGNQFLPPALGPDRPITLHIVSGKETQVVTVASLGLSFALGVLDMVILLKQQDAGEPAQEE